MVQMKIMSAEIEKGDPGSTAPQQQFATNSVKRLKSDITPFGRPPEFLGNRFVYAVISQRAHGLSIGINLNPDKCCNFDCAYCEVNREIAGRDVVVDIDVLAAELDNLLT